ncbi:MULTISPECIES: GNAT family N-acetyltransferase [Gordonia]|jgi:predicted GNAT superfamily acetyltransferase|uniref:GNAT family N-acetyltransferase n=1 Tax=Gordonia TaxID=2053 RepID=UPI0019C06CF4|nr:MULTISPECIES: GNAT family N-acetyltransferase [Gordonia]MBD0023586.1 GNAT family N-acetyltransferase [Gordonia sp. (in: high G+C Gram-positive bacteria)]
MALTPAGSAPKHSADPLTTQRDVVIRELTDSDDLAALANVFDDVWHPDPSNRVIGVDTLRTLAHTGNYVVGAFIDGVLAGGSVGFFGAPAGTTLHSHITGVSRLGRGHNLGHALKLYQREWAIERGLSEITWTFDPLVSRNAYFNLVKLGARPRDYLVDFYGQLGLELAGTDATDRLFVSWPLDVPVPDPPVVDPGGPGVVYAIDMQDHDHPQGKPGVISDAATVVVPVPGDIESMRRTEPLVAARWRIALREALAPLVDGPDRDPVTFLRSGAYVFGPVGGPPPE